MRVNAFLKGRPFSRDRLYRKLGQFVEEAWEDGRHTELDFTGGRGFLARRDRTRGRWTYEITDEDRFARFAHRLTEYDALTNEDIEWLLAIAAEAREWAYGRGDYYIALIEPDSDADPYDPKPEAWAAISQALVKADWPDQDPEPHENP